MRFFLAAALAWVPGFLSAASEHLGEVPKFEAQITFLDPKGFTTTDEQGVHYHFWGYQFDEPKVYPDWTFGQEYPLYFVGTNMNFSVTVKNLSSRGDKKFKIRVEALNNAMEADGSLGAILAPAQEWTIESLDPGDSQTVQGLVYLAPDPNLSNGLNVTKIRVLRINEELNNESELIKEEIAVWCPPKFRL